MCRIPCLILCLAYVERVCQCRAPNSPCGLHGRMASVIASLFSRSRPPPPAGLHATTPSVGQTSGATQRCLNPGFSERIGNSRRTGLAGTPEGDGRSRVAAACSASHGTASDWEPAAVETRAEPISLCRKRSFATYRDPHSVGGLTPPASSHSCNTSSEEPPLSNVNSQCDIPVIGDSSANFRS